eukprot:TRINITY_DN29408_c0_g3_i1.p1 TRINITY_DN29408_c0_g3~~TRINITY_DN29408_c0_g3_i1.p1  ORF type:complete len:342 (-),score=42.69 TRINITY_DN29408_c0_g3_i1:450-1475(-)
MGAACCRKDLPEDKYETNYTDRAGAAGEYFPELTQADDAAATNEKNVHSDVIVEPTQEAKSEADARIPQVLQGEPVEKASEIRSEGPEEHELPFQDRRFKEFSANVVIPEFKASSIPRRPSTTNITLEDYTKRHQHLFTNLLEMEKMDGWYLKKDEGGLQVYLKQEKGSHLLSFKAFTEMQLGKGGIASIMIELLNTSRRVEWDEMCDHAEKVERYAPYYGIGYVRLLPPAPIISKRDLCVVGRYKLLDDGGCLVAMQSVEHPDCSNTESQGYVRVDFIKGGYILRPIAGTDKVRVCWTGCVDPKGWIPTWLANLTCWKQGLTLSKFKVHIAKVLQEQENQ